MTPYRLFVDTSVLAYAVGGHHPMREPSRALLEASVEDKVEVHASTALVHGCAEIVSADPDFDRAPGLRRVSPQEALP